MQIRPFIYSPISSNFTKKMINYFQPYFLHVFTGTMEDVSLFAHRILGMDIMTWCLDFQLSY